MNQAAHLPAISDGDSAESAKCWPDQRRYLEEGTEVSGQIIEDSGWYVRLGGAWRWDEESQD